MASAAVISSTPESMSVFENISCSLQKSIILQEECNSLQKEQNGLLKKFVSSGSASGKKRSSPDSSSDGEADGSSSGPAKKKNSRAGKLTGYSLFCRDNKQTPEEGGNGGLKMQQISQKNSAEWKNLTDEIKGKWKEMADEVNRVREENTQAGSTDSVDEAGTSASKKKKAAKKPKAVVPAVPSTNMLEDDGDDDDALMSGDNSSLVLGVATVKIQSVLREFCQDQQKLGNTKIKPAEVKRELATRFGWTSDAINAAWKDSLLPIAQSVMETSSGSS